MKTKAEKEIYSYIETCIIIDSKTTDEIENNALHIAHSLGWDKYITEEWVRQSIKKAEDEMVYDRLTIMGNQRRFEETFMHLDKYIYQRPIRIDNKDMEPKVHRPPYHTINDRYIKIDGGGINWIELIIAGILFVFLFYFLLIAPYIRYNKVVDYHIEVVDKDMHQEDKYNQKSLYRDYLVNKYKEKGLEAMKTEAFEDTSIGDTAFLTLIIVILLGVLFWIYQSTKSIKDMLIFDRELGLVTFVCHFGKKKITKPFDWVLFQSVPTSMHFNMPDCLAIRFTRHSVFYLNRNNIYATISFFVWYMDRNRPLPPSEMLDTYREADYLRRKSEGFPQPIYYSGIKTPEWSGATEKYGDKGVKAREEVLYSEMITPPKEQDV